MEKLNDMIKVQADIKTILLQVLKEESLSHNLACDIFDNIIKSKIIKEKYLKEYMGI